MGMGELLTAVQNRLPIKIVVFNNNALAFVEVEMIAAGIVPFGTELKFRIWQGSRGVWTAGSARDKAGGATTGSGSGI